MKRAKRVNNRWLSGYLLIAVGLFALAACNSTADRDGQQHSINVVTSGGFAAAYNVLAPQFEAETGIKLNTAYGSSSGGAPDSIPVRLSKGEAIDVIILSKPSLTNLTALGEVDADSRTDLVQSKIGMAVKSGADQPDISSESAFITAVMQAKSIGYSASASGTYLSTKLFPRLGIWDAIEPKSQRILSKRVASVVASGEVEIGFQQISEILPIEGADYVGPIPAGFQKVTTFSAAITQRAVNREHAKKLLAYLSSTEVAETIAATGLQPLAVAQAPAQTPAQTPVPNKAIGGQ